MELVALSSPLFYIILGDFNARSQTSIEGTRLVALSSFRGLHQLIKEPTHLIQPHGSCSA